MYVKRATEYGFSSGHGVKGYRGKWRLVHERRIAAIRAGAWKRTE